MSVLQVSRPSADELGLSRRLRQALALPLLALALLLVLVGVLRPALLAWLVTVRAQAAARHHDRAGRRGLRASKGVGSGDAPFIITRTVADGLPRGQILSQ